MKRKQEAWVIVNPGGRVYWHTIQTKRSDAVDFFLLDMNGVVTNKAWRRYYNRGYRCKKVRVVE